MVTNLFSSFTDAFDQSFFGSPKPEPYSELRLQSQTMWMEQLVGTHSQGRKEGDALLNM